MLILTRRIGEKLVIAGDIKITVLKVRGNQVSLGVDAPIEVSVNREEIQKKIDSEIGGFEND